MEVKFVGNVCNHYIFLDTNTVYIDAVLAQQNELILYL